MQKRSWFAAGGLAAIVVLGGGLYLLRDAWNGEGPGEPEVTPPEVPSPSPVAESAPLESAPVSAASAKPLTPAPGAPGTGSVAGRLLRGDAAFAEGATINLRRLQGGGAAIPLSEVRSDADGRWLLPGVPGGIPLEIEIDDPQSALVVLRFWLLGKKGEKELDLGDLRLEAAHSLCVRVVGPDARPVRKAKVITWIWPGRDLEEKGFRAPERQFRESGEGEYVLERLPPGKVPVQVRAHGFMFKPNSPVWVEVPQAEPILVRLETGARIAGTVRDAAGKPIAGAELTAHGSPESQYYQGIRTDAAGRFEMDYLVPGEYQLWVEAKGYASQAKLRVPTGSGEIQFILEPEAVFSGRVVDEEGTTHAASLSPMRGV